MSISLPSKVLLVARDMLGDLVNTTGTVRALVDAYPGSTFTLEGGPSADQIGFVAHEVWTRPRHAGLPGRLKRIARWRKSNFGACIVLDDGHTHARLARPAGIPLIYGIHRGFPGLFTQAVEFDESEHDVFGQQRRLLEMLGLHWPDIHPLLVPTAEHEIAAASIFGLLGEPELLVHPGASDSSKTWPDEVWAELFDNLRDRRVAVMGGPGERAERFGLPSPSQTPAILEYAALLSKVKTLITPDTGPAHIAAAMGTPTVVMYGPTDPAHFHPWPNGNQTLLYRDQGCRHYGAGCANRVNGICSNTCTRVVTTADVLDAIEY